MCPRLLARTATVLLFISLLGPLLAQTPASPVHAAISQMVVFGDSLSDTGNVYIGTMGTSDPQPPPPPKYTLGEFTDGPDTVPPTSGPLGLWDQQLAKKLDLPNPAPFLSGGTNYAVGSAQTGHNPAFNAETLTVAPYIDDQVQLFLTHAGSAVPSDSLYVFWGGANDIASGGDPAAAALNIASDIDQLAGLGAKYFLWVNLPPLGETPAGRATGFSSFANQLSNEFNSLQAIAIPALEAAHAGISIVTVPADWLFGSIVMNPSAWGFTNVTMGAQGMAGVDPDTYVFWDNEHPTTAAGALLADLAYREIQGAFGLPAVYGAANAASGAPGFVSPGMLTLLSGTNLGPQQLMAGQLDPQTGRAATTLAGTRVLFNGIAAPLFYVQSGQVVAVAPYEIASMATVNVTVEVQGVASAPVTLQVLPSAPGLFSASMNGAGPAAAFNQDSTVNTSDNPAAADSIVVLFGTGEGQISPAGADGTIIPPTSPDLLPKPVLPVSVTIGGKTADVIYAGSMPSEVSGLLQINVRVPQGLAPGSQPVVVKIGSASSQANLTIAVK
jgi:uncharacterized protein (TIGR03437 family)